MSMSLTIRSAVIGDEAVLVRLTQFVQELHVANAGNTFRSADDAELAAWFRALFDKPNIRIWIAEMDDMPVGSVMVSHYEQSESPYSLCSSPARYRSNRRIAPVATDAASAGACRQGF